MGGSQELTALDILDERGDVHVYRTTFHARRLGAVKTTLGLGESLLLGETCVHLLGASRGAIRRIKLRHYYALDGHALLRLHALAELLAPFGLRVGEDLDGVVCGVFVHDDVGGSNDGVAAYGGRGAYEVLLIVSELFLLFALEGAHALEHLVPVNQSSIELRTVDADKLGLASNGQTARATHTRSVHHDCVQADFAGDVMLLGGEV